MSCCNKQRKDFQNRVEMNKNLKTASNITPKEIPLTRFQRIQIRNERLKRREERIALRQARIEARNKAAESSKENPKNT